MVAHEGNRIHGLEFLRQYTEHPEADGSVDARAVLVADDPREDAARPEDPMGFLGDARHFLIEAGSASSGSCSGSSWRDDLFCGSASCSPSSESGDAIP